MQQQSPNFKDDVRVKATAVILGISVAMMAVSVPLVEMTHSALIPLVVVIGAAIGTSSVWFYGHKPQNHALNIPQGLRQQSSVESEELENDSNIHREPRLSEKTLNAKEDVRVEASVRIWKIAALMLFIAMAPRSGELNVFIPLSIIGSAALATGAIWLSGITNRRSAPQTVQQAHLKELEERLANLETINNFERRLAEEALRRADESQNVPMGQVRKDEQNEIITESPTRFFSTGNR